VATVLLRRRGSLIPVLLLAGVIAGSLSAERERAALAVPLPAGTVTMTGRALDDPGARRSHDGFVFRPDAIVRNGEWHPWPGPALLVEAADTGVAAGERVLVEGRIRPGSAWSRAAVVAGRVAARRVEPLGPAPDLLFRTGNLLRDRVLDGAGRGSGRPAAALLVGFLIGDTSELPDGDAQALRRSGLSHFVAVSGSNVALFLAAWWLAMGPLGWGPRRRALLGLAGIAVFLVVTRWEPSVVRAGAMASLVLGGRLFGLAIDGWTALGTAVAGVLLAAPGLSGDVGFQLSVAATAGVLAGAGAWRERRPRWVWTALAATIAAQAAVAPLLLIHFGSVPLFAPLNNVVAAPLVAFATAAGGIGILAGLDPATGLGLAAADAVLVVARFGRDLPQLGWAGVLLVSAGSLLALRRRLRPLVALAGVLAVAAAVTPPSPPEGPQVTVLDVGQGDAVLLQGPSGEVVLIDGGPDPVLLRDALVSRGIRRIDLLVLSHLHADHTTGLTGITDIASIGLAWHADHAGEGGAFDAVLAELVAAGIPAEVPEPGWRVSIGAFDLEVLGPSRRYASPNDGSLVLRATAAGRSVLLAGDIETIAQADLGSVRADVLKVPHQGAATSDPDWLAAVAPEVALISVGPNTFGHPAPEVIAVLEQTGAVVRRTDEEGDLVVRLDRSE
jgi:competence protein ComEC